MKRNLGRVMILFFLLTATIAFSGEYSWSSYVNKKDVVTNEAVYLKYVCEFVDESELYVIEFNPVVDNDSYRIELLSESETIQDAKRINTFEFVLFVKKPGAFRLALDTTMKKTNRESIENGVLGRDNANYEEFSITNIKQETIKLSVKDAGTKLVGEFSLELKKDRTTLGAYEPFHLEFIIKGVGDFFALKEFDFKVDGVKLFKQKHQQKIRLTKDGYIGEWSQKFAFVSKESFEIPPLSIAYYNLKSHRIEKLLFNGLHINVEAPKYTKEQLLDKEEERFGFFKEYLYYLLTFIAGFIAAKIKFKSQKREKKTSEFCEKIASFKDIREAAIYLAMKDAKKYDEIISKIEKREIENIKNLRKLICS